MGPLSHSILDNTRQHPMIPVSRICYIDIEKSTQQNQTYGKCPACITSLYDTPAPATNSPNDRVVFRR